MQIILLSGGSGKRLWPLSNDARSKQFLKVLSAPDGSYESMVQRITRQITEAKLNADITVATSVTQLDSIISQLGGSVSVVTEPERRDTFPAIALATSYLAMAKGCSDDEIVIVMPSDPFTESGYFDTVLRMAEVIKDGDVDMALMGITPHEPSTKFGYIVPNNDTNESGIATVERFTEKPTRERAEELLAQGAYWNGGVFAFKLGYMRAIVERYIQCDNFEELHSRYGEFPKISFDYEVVEKAASIAVVPYAGEWHDLGTWNSLAEQMSDKVMGNVIIDADSSNSVVVNELDIPVVCLGIKDLVVAVNPDGILVSDKLASVDLKGYVEPLKARPMYEVRRWGSYKVLGQESFSDGYNALTKLLNITSGCNISYQYHNKREEIWTFIDGVGELILDGERRVVKRGDVVHIKAGEKHAGRAISDLQIIEVQSGSDLVEEDIIRLEWEW